jgi:uncharacterized protein (TIGR02271 family)
MTERRGVREGMVVYSADGEKLGKVFQCEAESFIIEKGFFFPKDYIARYEDVATVNGDEIRLTSGKDAFAGERFGRDEHTIAPGSDTYGYGTTENRAGAFTGGRDERWSAQRTSGTEDVRVPITEEELDVTKRERQAGEVRLKKEVVTEHKRVDVPVMKERVRVERVPASERTAAPGEAAFQKDTISVPIHEEEIEVTKRPVVKEELRVRKERQVEQRAAEAEIRKERVDVEGDGTPTIRSDDDFGGTKRE